jgi:nucleoside-diphosphate-sugar epimerase
MKIFVTGATGFIGRAFCHVATRRGHGILALSRNQKAEICEGVQIAAGSLADTPWDTVKCFAPDAALHLAWIAEPGIYLDSPENDVWLERSEHWLQCLIEAGVPYIAGTGTCIEYAASPEPLNEKLSRLDPQFRYSRCKVALYEWLRNVAKAECAWFRIFYPYGNGEHPNRFPSSVIRQLRAGHAVKIRTPASLRDYIFVDDAASGLCQALEARATGAINVGSGRGVAIQDLARCIAALLHADESLVQSAAGAPPDPTPSIVADVGRLFQTGWRPAIGVEEGLQRLIDSIPLNMQETPAPH